MHEDQPAPPWLARLEATAGPARLVHPLGGTAFLVEAGGRKLVAKLGRGARDEAEGLRRLRSVAGAPPVPDVVLAEDAIVVTTAVEEAPARAARHDDSLGRDLAVLHGTSLEHWGGGSSWIGACRVDAATHRGVVAFYGSRLLALAARCGLPRPVARVAKRLDALIPPGGPTLVHGDLWWGNVLSGADGRSWLIDPSVHGGHREEDLAMLALFGPVPDRTVAAYVDVFPLDEGWRERVELFQLIPLLVHTVLFGGGYRARAEAIAHRFG